MEDTQIECCVAVDYHCGKCDYGFQVIKSKYTIKQFCAECGQITEPIGVASVGIKIGGKWEVRRF